MTRPALKPFRAALAAAALLALALGPSDEGWAQARRRVDPSHLKKKQPARIEKRGPAETRARASGRLLVRFKENVPPDTAEGLLQAYRFRDVREIAPLGIFAVETPENMSVEEALAVLSRNPDIARAGPDRRVRLCATPNDPYFLTYQYNLSNRGGTLDISGSISLEMTAGADIKAGPAWDETRGDPAVVIAVLDSGVDMTHIELAGKVVSTGRDFANDDFDATDDNSHGTHVAGVAAADTDNGQGIAGVAWNAMILPVKVVEADGTGLYSWVIEGIIWAVDEGARVINLSLGGDEPDDFLEDACRYAFEKGVIVVAAAGNEDASVVYPAAYDRYVLAVAATDANDQRASFSNTGPEVDVAAPGVYILGPCPQWYAGEGYLPYLFVSGTSQATAHASGLAALILGVKPWLEPAEVMNIIRYTADDVNKAQKPGRDDELGYGRINMERALVPYVLR
jgi:thermitase